MEGMEHNSLIGYYKSMLKIRMVEMGPKTGDPVNIGVKLCEESDPDGTHFLFVQTARDSAAGD